MAEKRLELFQLAGVDRHDRCLSKLLTKYVKIKEEVMNLIVHRGTQQIGGSCVEVQSGADRILLDLGLPLPTGKDDAPIAGQTQEELLASGILPPINGVYAASLPKCALW